MKTIIIAEAGVNHNGDIDIAKQQIVTAAKANADYVKFQTFRPELNISKKAVKAEYQKKNTGKDETLIEMIKKLELKFEDFITLRDICEREGIGFLSTGFDIPSVDFVVGLDVAFVKIPSGEITNKPYLRHIAGKGKPVIMSTGMAYMDEIRVALNVLTVGGMSKDQITVLHCNTEYPTPMKDVNLKAMLAIQREFNVKIGYSDHTLGIEVPIAAVALGATVVEKHFTLDRSLPGPDHKASLEPNELKAMVKGIRNVEKALSGSGIKKPSPSESKNIKVVRKSIVAARRIMQGEKFSPNNIAVKRPGNGLSPMLWDEVIGKTAKKDFIEDECIEL